MLVDEARPGFARHSAMTESYVAVSPGEAGPSWPRADGTPCAVDAAVAMPAELQGRAPQQNPISQCPLVKLDLLGPEQRAGTAPAFTAVAIQLGLPELQSSVPRRDLNSQRVPVELGLLGPEQMSGTEPPLQQP